MIEDDFIDTIPALKDVIKDKISPTSIELDINEYLVEALEQGDLTLYEFYLINQERLRFTFRSIIEPAWMKTVSIFDVMDLIIQRILADIFEEDSKTLIIQCEEVYSYLDKNYYSKHYFLDLYSELIKPDIKVDALQSLLKIRERSRSLPEECHPTHAACLPGDYFIAEDLLLKQTIIEKVAREEILDFIVDINLM